VFRRLALVALVVVAGCTAGAGPPTDGPASPTGGPTSPTDGPCAFERPATDANGGDLDWPTPPDAGSNASVTDYAVAFERAYVAWNGTTNRTNVRSLVENASATRVDDGWRVRVVALRWAHPTDLPEGMTVTPGRVPYAATYLVTDERTWRVEHPRNRTPATPAVRNASLVDCPTDRENGTPADYST
jgi:hypothetical protein